MARPRSKVEEEHALLTINCVHWARNDRTHYHLRVCHVQDVLGDSNSVAAYGILCYMGWADQPRVLLVGKGLQRREGSCLKWQTARAALLLTLHVA